MQNYKEYFKGKKITMLGLGLLGRGLGDAKFLAECGANLTITDLKSAKDLEPTLKKLKKFHFESSWCTAEFSLYRRGKKK